MNKHQKRITNETLGGRSGATLVEVLLAVSILSVVAGTIVAIIKPTRVMANAYNITRSKNEKELRSALQQYAIDQGVYPDSNKLPSSESDAKPICMPGVSDKECGEAGGLNFSALVPEYVADLPHDVAEACDGLTGYSAHLQVGMPVIKAKHKGYMPGETTPVGECPLKVIQDGLVGWWKFNESSGSPTTEDSSESVNIGTLKNLDPQKAWMVVEGKNALDLIGANKSVEFSSYTNLEPTDTLTVIAWIRTSEKGNKQTIIDRIDNSNGFALYVSAGNQISLVLNGGAISLDGTKDVTDGNWHLISAVYDKTKGEMEVFVDGKSDASLAYSDPITYAIGTKFFIGSENSGKKSFEGYLSDVRIYDRVLTADELSLIIEGKG